jgi:cytochrome b-561 domain-containing protein 2
MDSKLEKELEASRYHEREKRSVDSSWSHLTIFEVFINNCNHALIAITTFYISWYSWKIGFTNYETGHTWYSTLGYQLFMAEGIMATYNRNTFTMGVKKRSWKIHIHWILQVIGTGFVMYGTILEIYKRDITNKKHFHSTHAVTGLVSFILLTISFVSGISALFAAEMRKVIKPILSKAAHNFISSACYVVGMVSIIWAYKTKRFMTRADPGSMRELMIVFCILNTVFTMVGPAKAFWNQLRNR